MAKTKKASEKRTATARKKVTTDRKSTRAKSKPIAKTAVGKAVGEEKSLSRPKSSARAKSENSEQGQSKDTVAVNRRTGGDRRRTPDRRTQDVPVAVERRKLERRVKVNRRRQIDPTTCERDYTTEEVEFMNSLEEYKRTSGRMFPTCSEILEVIRMLGYEKRPPAAPETAPETAPRANCDAASNADSSGVPETAPGLEIDAAPAVVQPTSASETHSVETRKGAIADIDGIGGK